VCWYCWPGSPRTKGGCYKPLINCDFPDVGPFILHEDSDVTPTSSILSNASYRHSRIAVHRTQTSLRSRHHQSQAARNLLAYHSPVRKRSFSSRYLNSYRCVDPQSLAALARTCRRFQNPALDILWSNLPTLKPLFHCLPKGLWTITNGGDIQLVCSFQDTHVDCLITRPLRVPVILVHLKIGKLV
jgi:hypothetical protein